MKKILICLAITIGLLFGCYVFPMLASAQTCGSYTGTPWGCYVAVEVRNVSNSRPIVGVTITSPLTICTTGVDGKCNGSRTSGTFNFYAKKAHYADAYCLALSCTNKGWSWKPYMQFNGALPTVFDNGGYQNHTVDWDRGNATGQFVQFKFIVPGQQTCSGYVDSYTVTLDKVYVGNSTSGTVTLTNPPLNTEGTLVIEMEDLTNQAPGRTTFQ